MDDFSHTDTGEVAVALIGENGGVLVDALYCACNCGGTTVSGFLHVAVKVIVSENTATDGSDTYDVIDEAELFYRFGDKFVSNTVSTTRAIVQRGVGQHSGFFINSCHYFKTSITFSQISSGDTT